MAGLCAGQTVKSEAQMTENVILISLAILPVIVLAIFIYRKDKFEKEPLRMLAKAFFFGCLSVIPAILIEQALALGFFYMGGEYVSGFVTGIYNGFIVAGCSEELCKLALLALAVWKAPDFNEYFDGIVYATFVALGFAGIENLMYVFRQETFEVSLMTGGVRAILSVPGHFLFAVVMGYYFALAKFNPDKAKWYNKEYLRLKTTAELTDLFIPVLEGHGIKVVDCPCNALTAGATFEGFGADFANHIFTREYVEAAVELVKERATFVADMWDIAHFLFVAPADFEAFGIKAGAGLPSKPVDPNRPIDPRAKVFDDAATAPFLAKDVDKFWKPEHYENCFEVTQYISGANFGFDDLDVYRGAMTSEALESAIEEYIKHAVVPFHGKGVFTLGF